MKGGILSRPPGLSLDLTEMRKRSSQDLSIAVCFFQYINLCGLCWLVFDVGRGDASRAMDSRGQLVKTKEVAARVRDNAARNAGGAASRSSGIDRSSAVKRAILCATINHRGMKRTINDKSSSYE